MISISLSAWRRTKELWALHLPLSSFSLCVPVLDAFRVCVETARQRSFSFFIGSCSSPCSVVFLFLIFSFSCWLPQFFSGVYRCMYTAMNLSHLLLMLPDVSILFSSSSFFRSVSSWSLTRRLDALRAFSWPPSPVGVSCASLKVDRQEEMTYFHWSQWIGIDNRWITREEVRLLI